MKLRLVASAVGGKCDLLDDDTGQKVGDIFASTVSVEFLSKFQGAKIVLDGKSLKRLGKNTPELVYCG